MTTNFDSYTLRASTPFGGEVAESNQSAHWTYSDDEDDDASIASEMCDDCEEEHVVEFPSDMGPNFLESGQLMWEIAAHTEGTTKDGSLPCMRPPHVPEIVFTDTSDWSTDFEEAFSKKDGKEVNDAVKGVMELKAGDKDEERNSFEKPKVQLLSGQHCFELMTDENSPLVSNSLQAEDDEAVECQREAALLSTSKLNEQETDEKRSMRAVDDEDVCAAATVAEVVTSPLGASISPARLVVPDQKWRKQQPSAIGNTVSENNNNNTSTTTTTMTSPSNKKKEKKIAARTIQSCTEETQKVDGIGSLVPSPTSKHVSGMPIADSAFDIFSTHDPRFVIGDNSSDEELTLQSPTVAATSSVSTATRSPKLSKINVQPLGDEQSIYETWTLHQPRDHTADDSPRVHIPGCSLKEVLSSAMSKFNEVLYNCTHTKQRKKEKEMLKRIPTSGKGTLTPNSSSAYGAYRRRNTIICQKMEGMINNEAKTKSTKKSTRSRLPSLAGAHASSVATSSTVGARQAMKRKAGEQ